MKFEAENNAYTGVEDNEFYFYVDEENDDDPLSDEELETVLAWLREKRKN